MIVAFRSGEHNFTDFIRANISLCLSVSLSLRLSVSLSLCLSVSLSAVRICVTPASSCERECEIQIALLFEFKHQKNHHNFFLQKKSSLWETSAPLIVLLQLFVKAQWGTTRLLLKLRKSPWLVSLITVKPFSVCIELKLPNLLTWAPVGFHDFQYLLGDEMLMYS